MELVRIGLKRAQQNVTVGVLREVWQIADDAGFDHCWLFDHLAAADPDPACRAMRLLWTESAADFQGRYYRLERASG